MKLFAPIKDFMTSNPITVRPRAKLLEAKELFTKHNFHHLPVVRYNQLVGIISDKDLLFFQKGFTVDKEDLAENRRRLNNYAVSDIMSHKLATLKSQDHLLAAVKIFEENLFHAIPIMEDNRLVGILTTTDLIRALAEDRESYHH